VVSILTLFIVIAASRPVTHLSVWPVLYRQ